MDLSFPREFERVLGMAKFRKGTGSFLPVPPRETTFTATEQPASRGRNVSRSRIEQKRCRSQH
jgi:hypothetical protein